VAGTPETVITMLPVPTAPEGTVTVMLDVAQFDAEPALTPLIYIELVP